MALERIADFLQDRKTGMVYADHYEWKEGEKKKHPAIDYQREVYAMTSTSGLCWHSEANT